MSWLMKKIRIPLLSFLITPIVFTLIIYAVAALTYLIANKII